MIPSGTFYCPACDPEATGITAELRNDNTPLQHHKGDPFDDDDLMRYLEEWRRESGQTTPQPGGATPADEAVSACTLSPMGGCSTVRATRQGGWQSHP